MSESKHTVEELSAKLDYLREVLEYALELNPEKSENELYPLVKWLNQKFKDIFEDSTRLYDLIAETAPTSSLNTLTAKSEDPGQVERLLKPELENLGIRLSYIEEQLKRIDQKATAEHSSRASERNTEETPRRDNMQVYDDIDIQFEELRKFITERTSHWRLYENFFYGIVIILLIANLFAVLWASF